MRQKIDVSVYAPVAGRITELLANEEQYRSGCEICAPGLGCVLSSSRMRQLHGFVGEVELSFKYYMTMRGVHSKGVSLYLQSYIKHH